MHQLRSFAITDSLNTSREGATWFRNARDLTREYRDAAIACANANANAISDHRVKESNDEEPEKADDEIDDDEAGETDSENAWLQSQGIVPSFAIETPTETTVSLQVGDGESSESEPRADKLMAGSTSMPAKRSLSKSHRRSGRRRVG
jgi:hypothetical protein